MEILKKISNCVQNFLKNMKYMSNGVGFEIWVSLC